MANGDITPVSVDLILQGDTWVITVQSGPGAGRWVARDGNIDLDERSGTGLFLAQGDITRLREWLDQSAGLVIEQYGVDQYGRLVGDLRYGTGVSNWSELCQVEGRGTYSSSLPSGDPWLTDWSPRRVGSGFGDQLTVTTSQP